MSDVYQLQKNEFIYYFLLDQILNNDKIAVTIITTRKECDLTSPQFFFLFFHPLLNVRDVDYFFSSSPFLRLKNDSKYEERNESE